MPLIEVNSVLFGSGRFILLHMIQISFVFTVGWVIWNNEPLSFYSSTTNTFSHANTIAATKLSLSCEKCDMRLVLHSFKYFWESFKYFATHGAPVKWRGDVQHKKVVQEKETWDSFERQINSVQQVHSFSKSS